MNEQNVNLLKSLVDEWTDGGRCMDDLQFRHKADVIHWLKEQCRYDDAAELHKTTRFSLCGRHDGRVWAQIGNERIYLHDYKIS